MSTQHTRLMMLHAFTFLHPGTGQTTGVVDLPVQREVHTGFPMIASSGLKGAMRDKAERQWCWIPIGSDTDKKICPKANSVFGPDTGRGEAAGALAVSDARILLLPVRSLQKVFLWVTCPMVLARLARDVELAQISEPQGTDWTSLNKIKVGSGSFVTPNDSGLPEHVALEELRLDRDNDSNGQTECASLATLLTTLVPRLGDLNLPGRLVVIGDEDFAYLCRHALQVSARIALNDRKTTTGGGGNLWYEETLPPETIFYALLLAEKPRYEMAKSAAEPVPDMPADAAGVIKITEGLFAGNKDRPYLQVGGNETVGQGWCHVTLVGAPTVSGSGVRQ